MQSLRRRHSAKQMTLVSLLLLAAFGAAGMWSLAAAQDASPVAAATYSLPVAASPELCTAEPRPIEDYEALLGTPSAGELPPTVITAGTAADQATVDRVIAALVEIGACQSAMNFRSLDSLYTDAGFLEESGGGMDQESFDFITAQHEPLEEADWAVIYDVAAVQVLADGRIAAIAQFGPEGRYGVDLMIFVDQDGQLLIDQWVDEPFDVVPDLG